MTAPGSNSMRTTYQDSFPNPFQQHTSQQQHAPRPPLSPQRQLPRTMMPPQQPALPSQLQRHPSAQLSRTQSYEETYRMSPSASVSSLRSHPSASANPLYPPIPEAAPISSSAVAAPQQYPPHKHTPYGPAADSSTPSAPSLSDHHAAHSAAAPPALSIPSFSAPPHHEHSTTANDAAIAHALARELGTSPSISIQRKQEQEANTSLDHALALQTHDEEVERLCEQDREAATPSPEPPSPLGHLGNAWNGVVGHVSNLVPVIPRVNSVGPWGVDTRTTDRERLQCRLDFYALAERQVKGDGNCQFRALSDQLYGSEVQQARVRQLAVQQLAARPDKYAMYVPTEYQSYVSDMAKDSTWGDHVSLQAIADALSVHIHVVSSFLENAVISIHPSDERDAKGESAADPNRTLWLSFWAEVHYNSIYPKGSHTPSTSKKVLGSRTLGKVVRALSPGVH